MRSLYRDPNPPLMNERRSPPFSDKATHADELAADANTPPDTLLGLAREGGPAIRRAVAGNPSSPVRAHVLLALDSDQDVRAILAARAADIVPKLSQAGIDHAHALALHTLELLAIDKALQVRQALATSLKDVAYAPAPVVKRLAQDIMREVAEPILRYCLALSDDDLIELITAQKESWARQAIAARPRVSERVADAIVETKDTAAIGTLLDNTGAVLSDDTLNKVVDIAENEVSLQMPLARRPQLPPRLAHRLAEFVDHAVLTILREKQDLDQDTVHDVVHTARRRMDWAEAGEPGETSTARAQRLFQESDLTEEQISDALSWHEMAFVTRAIALRARVPEQTVANIFASQSPKSVTALTWRAGLSMRMAMQLQTRAANISPRQMLNARNGTDYPLTDVQMIWQLELFDIKT